MKLVCVLREVSDLRIRSFVGQGRSLIVRLHSISRKTAEFGAKRQLRSV